jgi:NADPH:quinone reductase-like Zn-dependent oxidoreductase
MLALVNTPNGKAPVELRQTPEPAPALHEALVAVQAFSLNRGELRSFRNNEEGWIPGPLVVLAVWATCTQSTA